MFSCPVENPALRYNSALDRLTPGDIITEPSGLAVRIETINKMNYSVGVLVMNAGTTSFAQDQEIHFSCQLGEEEQVILLQNNPSSADEQRVIYFDRDTVYLNPYHVFFEC